MAHAAHTFESGLLGEHRERIRVIEPGLRHHRIRHTVTGSQLLDEAGLANRVLRVPLGFDVHRLHDLVCTGIGEIIVGKIAPLDRAVVTVPERNPRQLCEPVVRVRRNRPEVVVRIEGDNVYGALKFESGGHRVQRVPATETQGRIHTSACTVAVLAEPDEAEAIKINPSDLRIDTYRASGAGGQHINKTDSAVRITHLPTGIVAECQDGRSQHSNKAQALKVLTARIQEKDRSERAAKDAAERKSLIGSGDRSDRIRTYNFPQGRLTDHRINLTLYKLLSIMEGDLKDVINALQAYEAAEQLAALEIGATT